MHLERKGKEMLQLPDNEQELSGRKTKKEEVTIKEVMAIQRALALRGFHSPTIAYELGVQHWLVRIEIDRISATAEPDNTIYHSTVQGKTIPFKVGKRQHELGKYWYTIFALTTNPYIKQALI